MEGNEGEEEGDGVVVFIINLNDRRGNGGCLMPGRQKEEQKRS